MERRGVTETHTNGYDKPNFLFKHHNIWCDVYIAFVKGLARSLNFNRCQSVMVGGVEGTPACMIGDDYSFVTT